MKKPLYISMYHYTRDLFHSRYPNLRGLDYRFFEAQLRYFKENFYVVTMNQVLESLDGGILPKNALLLTFDDGYIDNLTVALPLLKKYGLQGSFFISGKTFAEDKVLDVNKIHFILASANASKLKVDVFNLLDKYRSEGQYAANNELYEKYGEASRFDTADVVFIKRILQFAIPEYIRSKIADELFQKYVGVTEAVFARELYMNCDQIRHLKNNGMFIGLHGYDHYWLGNLEQKMMENDLCKAIEVMNEFIDRDEWVMNYPYGHYNDDVINFISSHGCKLGLTTEVRVADLGIDNRYKIPRLDCNDFPPKSENYKNI